MTYRHAVKDADNNVPFGETLPVHYNALAGLTVEETESLQDYDAFPVVGSGVFEGMEGTGGIFRDMIQVQDAEVLFHYADAFYPGIRSRDETNRPAGELCITWAAVWKRQITKLLMEQVMRDWHRLVPSREGLEIVRREKTRTLLQMPYIWNSRGAELS
ncbi:MAG: hypothetical protein V8R97_04815 [Fusicatenibacter saccharivorans]